MAANLSGMFAQLNNAINKNPMAQGGVGDGMMSDISRHAGNLGGYMTKQDPYSFMTQEAKVKQGQADLGKLPMDTAAGMAQAAQVYGKMGMTDQQLAMTKMATDKQAADLALQQKQKLRESLAKRAQDSGLTGLSEGIASGAADLEEAAKEVREMEKMDLMLKRGSAARVALGEAAGLTRDEVMSLKDISDEQFKDVISGQSATVEAYQNSSGKAVMLSTDGFGRVWDEKEQKYKRPSEMGLTPAPSTQKVHNVSNKMVEGLALNGVDNFNELYEAANAATDAVDNINRNLPLIDSMPTGLGAEVSLFARRVATLLGDDPDKASVDAQVYMADAGQRTAQAIKAFGAGTGLSDKDREYAEKMAGGSITVDGPALKKILRIQRDASQGIITHFNETKARIAPRLGEDVGVLDMYTLKEPRTTAPETVTRLVFNPETGKLEPK